MNKGLVSIVLPVYNGEKYLSQSIESCLNQTYKNIELIIVNDCSTDATLMIASHYAKLDSRVKVVNNEKNQKLPASLNIGHKEAKGAYVTWTSDDNFYRADAIEILLDELEIRKVDVVYSDFYTIDEEGQVMSEVEYVGFENIIFGNFVGACFLYKKEVYQKNMGYDESLFLVEDYDFWLRAAIHSRFLHIKSKLYYYRKHGDTLTYEIKNNQEVKQLWKENLKKMYANFCSSISENGNEEIAVFLTQRLSYQKITFGWFVNNHKLITDFKFKLNQNPNFSNSELVEKVFLKQTIAAMVQDSLNKSYIKNSIFIFKKYFRHMVKNDYKTLIKYSFFKKK